jgi:transposase
LSNERITANNKEKQNMQTNKWLKVGLGATIVAVVASIGLATATPTLAQSAASNSVASSTMKDAEHRGGPGFGRGGANHAVVAKALGITEAELQTEAQAGKSVAEIAQAKGVSLNTIVDAVIAAETERLKQAVTDGRLTQAQADTKLANMKLTLPSHLQTKPVLGLPMGGKGGRGFGRGGANSAAIAKALGITEAELRTEVQTGKTIAQIAQAKGVSLNTVVDAVVAAETERLKQAVTDGRITQEQADAKIAQLKTNLPQMFQQTLPLPGKRGPGGRGTLPNNTPAQQPAGDA